MIYIVIPVLNRWHFTAPCLDCLQNQSYKKFEVIVIDHGSTDGTIKNIIKNYPWVTLLLGNKEMWWAGATNLGVKYAMKKAMPYDYILTLNNDVEVDNDYLKNLNHAAYLQPNSIIGSISADIHQPEKIVFAGTKWNAITAKYKRLNILNNQNVLENFFIESDLLPGRGTLIPTRIFKELGVYDEKNFPHYAADEDFSLRAKKAGYSLFVNKNCVVKSYTYATGMAAKNKRTNPVIFFKSLGTIKSANNLAVRWRWAKKNTPVPLLYFGFDSSRIMISHLRSYVIKNA